MRHLAPIAALVAAAGLLWQARPVLVWHGTVLPGIERSGRAERVRLTTLRNLPAPDPAWPRLRSGALAFQAPVRDASASDCLACEGDCIFELEQGRLTLQDNPLPASHAAATAQFAPSQEDVSIWRPRWRNWRSVEALAARASDTADPPEAFRYRAAGSRGIVSRFDGQGIERFVIYAFPLAGEGGRVLTLSRTGSEVLHRVLGGLEMGAAIGSRGCEGGAAG